MLHAAGKPRDGHLHTVDHYFAAARQCVSRLRLIAGGCSVLGNVMDRGSHFVDGRGHLIGFALLTEHALAHLLHARRQMRCALIEAASGLRNSVDHSLITGLHGIEGLGHLPDLIVTAVGNTGRQIAAFFDVQHHVFERVELAEQKADQQLRGTEHQ